MKTIKDKYIWKGKKILIVEDDETGFIYLKELLRYTGVKIIHAIDGSEAINEIKVNPNTDLIIMDIYLPRLDGITATKIIKKINKNILVIAITAAQETSLFNKDIAANAGCDEYFSKPFDGKTFLSMIDQYFKKQA